MEENPFEYASRMAPHKSPAVDKMSDGSKVGINDALGSLDKDLIPIRVKFKTVSGRYFEKLIDLR